MQLLGHGTELQLKVAVKESELLSLLRSEGRSVSSRSSQHRQPRAGSRTPRTTEVVARFSTDDDTVTLTAKLRQSFPLHFILRPKTKTYGNFIRFVVRELNLLSAASEETKADPRIEARPEAKRMVSELSAYLERKLSETADDDAPALTDSIDIFGRDFEVYRGRMRSVRESALGRELFRKKADKSAEGGLRIKSSRRKDRKLRVLESAQEIEPTFVSSFMGLEIQEVSVSRPESLIVEHNAMLRFLGSPQVNVEGRQATITTSFALPFPMLSQTDFFIHWGDYNGKAAGWIDEEIARGEIRANPDYTYTITKAIRVPRAGHYGATFYARLHGTDHKIWQGQQLLADARFTVVETFEPVSESTRRRVIERIDLQAALLHGMASYERFVRTVANLAGQKEGRGLGKILADLTRDSSDLRNILSEYYQRALYEFTHDAAKHKKAASKTKLELALSVLQNLGVGEIVLVSPEGPHAISGGLAQAVVGLMSSISRSGIPVSLITTIFEEANGNKHKDAETLIREGVKIEGQLVPIEQVGEVKIALGPTYLSGTEEPKAPAQIVTAQVYRAEAGLTRIFFLRHAWLANRIYPASGSDDQLRRSIFLCRGAIETIRNDQFEIDPHILISNDWMTGLIPGFLHCDPNYVEDSKLREIKTAHILHNCGRDYQGRHLVNQFGEDLWPLLGLPGEHFFGFSDPNDNNYLNLTAAAVYHVEQGLLAVSKPYAQQLLTPEGGEGLDRLFRARKNLVFGISNGVDLRALRRIFWQVGENARAMLDLSPLLAQRYNDRSFLKRLTTYKQATKALVQKKYGLKVNPNAVLISFVGRLTEQKGIQLFSAPYSPDGATVLEAVLRQHPDVQLFIGGPPSDGDPAVESLKKVMEDLTRRYPGRVRGIFSFILHQDALEVTKASDFFLMPSRYEPGGITQLEALAAGTLVIARNVGGIAATLVNYNSDTGEGNAFLFERFTAEALGDAMFRALAVVDQETQRRRLLEQAALAENDWGHRAPKYLALFQHIAGVLAPNLFHHLSSKSEILASIRAA